MVDYTKVNPGDRFRVARQLEPGDEMGKELVVERLIGGAFDALGFIAHDGHGYIWSQVEPITEPALITRPIEGMPEWLANTPRGVAVQCRVKTYIGRDYLPEPRWIVGRYYVAEVGAEVFIDTQKEAHFYAEPWTEPEPKPSHFTLEQLAELDARYGRPHD